MRVLVTGAGGFVGRYLIEHLVAAGDKIIASDRNGNVQYQYGEQVENCSLDVADADRCSEVISRFQPEVIYHLAGIAFVPEAENNFDRALLVNVGGTNNIIRAVHLLQLGCTVVVVSSAEVYGRIQSGELPISETCPLRPANNYSLSKVMAELVAARYEQFNYVRPLIMRPFNHVGPGQDNRFVVSSFAQQLARIAAGKSAPLIRVGNLDAERDFSDVRDIVRAYRLAALHGSGTYNLCSGKAVSIQWILDTLISIAGVDVEIKRDPARMRPSEVPRLYGSYAKAEKELGWRPEIALRQTLEATYEDCLKNIEV